MKTAGIRRHCVLLIVIALVGSPVWIAPLPATDGEYVGEETCATCHEDTAANFAGTAHGRNPLSGWDAAMGCEACHGPGSEHVETDGETALAMTGSAETDPTSVCLGCHGGEVASHWDSSMHDTFGVGCADCHVVHQEWTSDELKVARKITDKCLTCHNNLRKGLQQRSRHPLKEGLMSCVSCHSPHGSPAAGEVSAITPNDKCYECHAEQRGPFLFPHQPVAEDCGKCHSPHGSNQASMLIASAPRLCQSCHLFGHHQTVPGKPKQVWNVNRSCVNCHARVHGSNHPSGVIFLR